MNIFSIEKPWGGEDVFTENEISTVKILKIKKGEMFSLQYHRYREEFWKVLEGNPDIIAGTDTLKGKPGETFTIKAEMLHRISAPVDDVSVLEISTGHFDENDIIRVEDKYGRIYK